MLNNMFVRKFAEGAVRHTVASNSHKNPLDVRFGMALVRDKRVPIKSKLLAFGLGVALLALLLAFEVPVEWMVSLLAPILLPLEIGLDGFELIALPLLFTTLIVIQIAPRETVGQIRAERLGLPYVPTNSGSGANDDVIDIRPVSVA